VTDVDGEDATWWGQAWLDALEHRASFDRDRLERGRAWAREGQVAQLEILAGAATARVRSGRALPYRVTLTLPTHPEQAWDRLARAIAGRAGDAAALVEGTLPSSMAAFADRANAPLLPAADELHTRCSCLDWEERCEHAAATAHLVSHRLAEHPEELLVLRGGSLADLRARVRLALRHDEEPGGDPEPRIGTGPGGSGPMVAAAFGGGAVVDPGVVARSAWSRPPPEPAPGVPVPGHPGAPPPWPATLPRDAPFTTEGLEALAADTAHRAWAQLAEGAPSHLQLSEAADLARRAADHLDQLDALSALARRSTTPIAALTRRAIAWRSAGSAGIEAIDDDRWLPPAEVIDIGLAAFEDAGADASEVRVRANRLTLGEVQLRVTPDGRWWRYERHHRQWELVEPPTATPADLLGG
jgi:hypothetical protein